MNAFFYVSKLAWVLLAPSNVIFLLGLLALVFLALRWRRWALRLFLASTILGLLLVVLPAGDLMLRPLEQRFPAYPHCTSFLEPIAGVIVIGGGLGSITVGSQVNDDMGEASDRIRYAAALGRTHPGAPILVSGGVAFPRPGGRTEAQGMADLLAEMGVNPARIVYETGSRTTAENARFAVDQARRRPGVWLLVTSAYHMPRAIGAFRKAGVNVIAAPTDWRVDDTAPLLLFSASDRLSKIDLATKEYLGLLAYWATGRSSGLLPGPNDDGACAPGSINAPPTPAPSAPQSASSNPGD